MWLEKAARYVEAIDQLDRLHEDQRRILGSEHPDTEVTRVARTRLPNRAVDETP